MKGIYALFGMATEKDLASIARARQVFDYVTVAAQTAPMSMSEDERIKYHASVITSIRKGLGDSIGLAIDFFNEGQLSSFLERSQAVSWVVPRGISAELVSNIDFPKYFIN